MRIPFCSAVLFSAAALALPARPAAAQAPADSATTSYSNSLGLFIGPDYRGLFAGRAQPIGILYRRQLAPRQWLRAGVSGYTRRYEHIGLYFPSFADSTIRQHEIGGRLGYEYVWLARGRWQCYAGVEAQYRVNIRRENARVYYLDRPTNYPDTILTVPYKERTKINSWSAGLVAGTRFSLHRHVALCLESYITYEYSSLRRDGRGEVFVTYPDGSGSGRGITAYQRNTTNRLGLRPFNQLRLEFLF